MKKILIIRFSSFGDIVQVMGTLDALKVKFPDSEIHWATRSDMTEFIRTSPLVDKIHEFPRKAGLGQLFSFSQILREENYDGIYDAHLSLRSRILLWMMGAWFSTTKIIRKPKYRINRFLLFRLRIDRFEKPQKTFYNFLRPLKEWDVVPSMPIIQVWEFPQKCQDILEKYPFLKGEFICLAPSAAWKMKRWPLSHWRELIENYDRKPIVLLGGPEDQFCEELRELAPERVHNFAGKLSLLESCFVVSKTSLLLSADTGLLHVADILGVSAFAFLGPTAFGRPCNANVKIFEVDLPCRPCTKDGRGKCSQDIYQKCMVEISPKEVLSNL